ARAPDLGLAHEHGPRLGTAIHGVDNHESLASGHQLLEQGHPAYPGLDHLGSAREIGESLGDRRAESIVAPQHVPDAADDDAPAHATFTATWPRPSTTATGIGLSPASP